MHWPPWFRPIMPAPSAPIARRWSPPRMPASWPTWTRICWRIRASRPRGSQQAETDAASAEADRDAGLQALQSLGVDPQLINDTQEGKATARGRRHHPRAHRRHGGGKTDPARPAFAGQHHAGLHRRRPVEGLGDGAYFRHRYRRGASGRYRPGDGRRPHAQRHGGQYRRRGGPQHPLHRGADRGEQSGRFPQAADVCPGPHPGPPGRRRAF